MRRRWRQPGGGAYATVGGQMTRISAVWILAGICACSVAAQERVPVQFDVASVKLSEPSTQMERVGALAEQLRRAANRLASSERRSAEPSGRWLMRHATLREILVGLYPDYSGFGQIVDGPEWVDSLRFDIDGRAPQNSSGEQIKGMARRLLADRLDRKSVV